MRLEMWRLDLVACGSWLVKVDVLPWGLVIVSLVLALLLITLMWEPVAWSKRDVS